MRQMQAASLQCLALLHLQIVVLRIGLDLSACWGVPAEPQHLPCGAPQLVTVQTM